MISAPANLAIVLEILPSPAPANFLAGFVRCQCSCLQYVQLIMDKTNVADLTSGVARIHHLTSQMDLAGFLEKNC